MTFTRFGCGVTPTLNMEMIDFNFEINKNSGLEMEKLRDNPTYNDELLFSLS
jgi:hypothetical protein